MKDLRIFALAIGMISLSALAQTSGNKTAPPTTTPQQSINALSTQASAEAIESCNNKMQALLAALDKGDYAGAEMDFNDTMKAGLPPERLKQVWETLPEKFGKRGIHESPQSNINGTFVVVNVTTPYEKANVVTQVVCGANGKIAGFNARSMTAPPAAASAGTSG